MYNFLDSKLTPNVKTDTPTSEGHEVNNLISEFTHIRNKGFLAFSAIRPPVEVDFELICPVKIHYVTIWNTVNSQKSSGYEIYAKSDDLEYKIIGKTFPEGSGFAMCNRKLYGKKKPDVPSDFSICFFKGNEYKRFNCTDKIKIRIIRTDSSVPCIGRIEIWGEVARSCTEKTRETISYLMKPKPKPVEHSEPSTSKTESPTGFEIPIDFVDEITCEIMSIPMTLPSGKSVDQTTLDKHQHNEALLGRSPSDPFTGIPFTTESKPVLNQALKNRIDDFLLKNKNQAEVMTVPRTVGKRKTFDIVPEYARVSKKIKPSETNTFQSTSAEDLDLAIEDAISKYNIIRYSKVNEDPSIDVCCFCKKNINNLYTVKVCSHLICRQCLINIKTDYNCAECEKSFKKSDVEKYHK